jgi:hypothetical protein
MHVCLALVAVALVCLAEPVPAQSRDASLQSQGALTQPSCCSIVRIDTTTSIVTARETATGYTFRFAVRTRRALRALRIGQPVWADFTSNTVKLKATDDTPCCGILPPETP